MSGNPDLASLFNNPPATNNNAAPRAYLNYIFLDEQFNFVKEVSGFKRVSSPGDGQNNLVTDEIRVRKNGYVYVYLSNESGEPVYFDNFSVSHERGRLVAEDHYYAYGLKIASISSRSVSSSLNPNLVKYGYQGSFAEEVSEFELNYNEFALRTYDPQIGRWTTLDPYDEFASPYLGMGTNPANLVDPNGGSVFGAIMSFFGASSAGAGCASTAGMVGFGYVATSTASTVATVIRVATVALSVGGATFTHFGSQMMASHMSGLQGRVGGSATQESGVQETGEGIGQALNNNISANTGNGRSITVDDLNKDNDNDPVIKFAIEATLTSSNPSERGPANDLARIYIFGEFDTHVGNGYLNIAVPKADAVFRFDIINFSVSNSNLYLESDLSEDDIALLSLMSLNILNMPVRSVSGIVKEAKSYYEQLQQTIKKDYRGASETFGLAKSVAKKELKKISENLKGIQQELLNVFRSHMEYFGVRHYYEGWDIATPTRAIFKGDRFYFTPYPFYIIESGIEVIYKVK